MLYKHGGNIYDNNILNSVIDFSVNLNPQGVPQGVIRAIKESINRIDTYPEPHAQALSNEISIYNKINQNYITVGNGASELIVAICNSLRPKRAMTFAPSFYGYEHGVRACGGELEFVELRDEELFGESVAQYERLLEEIQQNSGVELVFLTNPNNPTGSLIPMKMLEKIIQLCRQNEIIVVLDECFIEFTEGANSLIGEIEKYNNLIILRAFTKIYSIPGVRLGYCLSSNGEINQAIRRQLPEWNVSVIAQNAGRAALLESEYVSRTVELLAKERAFLLKGLKESAGEAIVLSPGASNFIFFKLEPKKNGVKNKINLYEEMLKMGILIRDCSNYRGLCEGFYRIAIKDHESNEIFMDKFKKVMKEHGY